MINVVLLSYDWRGTACCRSAVQCSSLRVTRCPSVAQRGCCVIGVVLLMIDAVLLIIGVALLMIGVVLLAATV